MSIKDLLGSKSDCGCGKLHSCDIKYVETGENALDSLTEVAAPFTNILLVCDENTAPLCRERVLKLLGDKISSEVCFSKDIVIPNEEAISKVEAKINDKTDFIIGIGSGVINDICKHVSFANDMRYAIIATAPSMDGYASVGAALILNEMKVTLNARVPYAIIAESKIVATAPMDMIQSGYGDIVGKYSCLNDWRLAAAVRNEYFCDYVYNAVMDTVKKVEGTAKKLLMRDPEAINTLTEALITVGIMMSYVGNSRPASGSEHHLSHFFEITGLLDNREYFLHGIDVLYSAAVTASLRKKLLDKAPPFPSFTDNVKEKETEIRRIYKTAADGILELQEKVGLYKEADTALLAEKWAEITEILNEAPSYEKMLGYISDIGLDINEFYAFYGSELLEDAVKYAKDLKDRYTVLWIAYVLNVL